MSQIRSQGDKSSQPNALQNSSVFMLIRKVSFTHLLKEPLTQCGHFQVKMQVFLPHLSKSVVSKACLAILNGHVAMYGREAVQV